MGRYYTGDIEGKFWFAVQSSDDADFFGVRGYQPEELNYDFCEDDLKDVEKGVKICLKKLGKYKKKLDKFFKERSGYSDKEISESLGIKEDKVSKLLVWYARLELGVKIRKCLKENKSCSFVAEC